MDRERESNLIQTFVVRDKRDRYRGFVVGRRRKEFLRQLHHFADFDVRWITPLPRGIQTSEALISELRRRGAPLECYVASDNADLDGFTGRLEDVITRVYANVEGTLVCCIPGRLAYYEGEAPHWRFILDRQIDR